MNYMDALAKNWREHDYSFEGRDVLPNGDEVWIYTTLELGLLPAMMNQQANIGVGTVIARWYIMMMNGCARNAEIISMITT